MDPFPWGWLGVVGAVSLGALLGSKQRSIAPFSRKPRRAPRRDLTTRWKTLAAFAVSFTLMYCALSGGWEGLLRSEIPAEHGMFAPLLGGVFALYAGLRRFFRMASPKKGTPAPPKEGVLLRMEPPAGVKTVAKIALGLTVTYSVLAFMVHPDQLIILGYLISLILLGPPFILIALLVLLGVSFALCSRILLALRTRSLKPENDKAAPPPSEKT